MRPYFALVICSVLMGLAAPLRAESEAERIQAALDDWVAKRAEPEGITGISAYVSFGAPGPGIEAFAGRTGRDPGDPLIDKDTLFGMGSTSKSFLAAVILKLEATGALSIEDRLGDWLPQYPAWAEARIRQLLDMTSGIPNYSETKFISDVWTTQPKRDLTAEELVAAAYPTGTNDLPVPKGYFYSNTNYILASMIAEKAGGKPYRDLVREMVLEPLGLRSTYYEPGTYPPEVVARMAHGYFENSACADYQPDCAVSWNQPLVGQDIRDDSTSWAQAAGGAVSTARDVDTWMRAVFDGRVVPPKQQAEWERLVSTRTGEPITSLSEADPMGFALGLAKGITPDGPIWFYQGTTLGYRTLYAWFAPEKLMITVQTNSQPDDGANQLQDAVSAIYEIVRAP